MITTIELVKRARAEINQCDCNTLCQAIDNQHLIIDVREADEYSLGHIAHAINVPRGLIEFAIFDHPQIKRQLDQVNPAETPVYLYCKSGGRSALAAQSLQNLGFKKIYSLQGGIMDWENQGFKIDTENQYRY